MAIDLIAVDRPQLSLIPVALLVMLTVNSQQLTVNSQQSTVNSEFTIPMKRGFEIAVKRSHLIPSSIKLPK
ncbi:MAG: hypothetical protein WBA89_00180 [Microcoleus sp.]|uniref:hypothetical protein n=1 Tax=Microcoleus sp. TaxID=44472 RepID=UPI003C76CC5F